MTLPPKAPKARWPLLDKGPAAESLASGRSGSDYNTTVGRTYGLGTASGRPGAVGVQALKGGLARVLGKL